MMICRIESGESFHRSRATAFSIVIAQRAVAWGMPLQFVTLIALWLRTTMPKDYTAVSLIRTY